MQCGHGQTLPLCSQYVAAVAPLGEKPDSCYKLHMTLFSKCEPNHRVPSVVRLCHVDLQDLGLSESKTSISWVAHMSSH